MDLRRQTEGDASAECKDRELRAENSIPAKGEMVGAIPMAIEAVLGTIIRLRRMVAVKKDIGGGHGE
jgi:hypothetical protein